MRYPSQLDLNVGILVVLSKFIPSQYDNDKVISVADLKNRIYRNSYIALDQLVVVNNFFYNFI